VNFIPLNWLALTKIAVARPTPSETQSVSAGAVTVSVIVPARNEAGNIETILKRVPQLGSHGLKAPAIRRAVQPASSLDVWCHDLEIVNRVLRNGHSFASSMMMAPSR